MGKTEIKLTVWFMRISAVSQLTQLSQLRFCSGILKREGKGPATYYVKKAL